METNVGDGACDRVVAERAVGQALVGARAVASASVVRAGIAVAARSGRNVRAVGARIAEIVGAGIGVVAACSLAAADARHASVVVGTGVEVVVRPLDCEVATASRGDVEAIFGASVAIFAIGLGDTHTDESERDRRAVDGVGSEDELGRHASCRRGREGEGELGRSVWREPPEPGLDAKRYRMGR